MANEQSIIIAASDLMPDGNGGWQPVPKVLTPAEAVRYLGLDNFAGDNPVVCLERYRKIGKLKGTYLSRTHGFTVKALDDFLDGQTKTNRL
ncbi:MAG: hypothetical protein ISS79_00015 [Phycisphaerae bacterium]|nr:hypothetical protein [Phycisphaerae bacterium]